MVLANATPVRAGAGTVEELLQTAERLFARDGVENVALTQIVSQAGQKNRSALHYHFGSRAGVLAAVLNRRLAAINARREAMMGSLPANPTVAAVLHAEVTPLAQTVLEEPWGADYLSILAQITFHPQLLGAREVEVTHLSGLRRGRALLERAMPPVPAVVLDRRIRWFKDSVVFALARWAQESSVSSRTPADLSGLVSELVAYGAAALAAPHPSTSGSQTP